MLTKCLAFNLPLKKTAALVKKWLGKTTAGVTVYCELTEVTVYCWES